jgi:pimeloyl-ACP methyl ester carboxylesterase
MKFNPVESSPKPTLWRKLPGAFALLAAVFISAMPARAATSNDLEASRHEAVATKTVVMVHGAFADGSCWADVIRILQARGVNVVAVQNPLVSLAGDAAAAQRIIDQQTQPVVLVGHSWGGVVITEAGVNPKVTALVYVAAFGPDVGESVYSLLQAYPAPAWLSGIVQDAAGFQTLNRDTFLNAFAPDLPARQAQTLFAVQGPTFGGTLFETATMTAWRSKPSWYVVADDDQIIPPALQRSMASRMRARTSSAPASHLVILSHPEKVARAILEAVRAR